MSTQPSTQRTFDAPTIEEALAKVRAELGSDALIVQAEKVRKGGMAGFFAREHFEVTVALPDDEAAEPQAQPEVSRPASILDLADQVSEAERRTAPVGAVPSTETPAFAEVMRRIAGEAGLLDEAPAPTPERAMELLADEPAPEPEPAADDDVPTFDFSAMLPARRATTDLVPVSFTDSLVRLGLPDELVPLDCDPETLVPRLLRHLRRLPAPPPLPSAPGSLTCIAGQQDEALALARRLAEDLGIDPDGVLLAAREPARRAGARTLTSPATAGEQARAWRTVGTSRVVALATAPGEGDTRWARRMLEALSPDTVWGRADARRKTEDIAAWCDDLGGLDALAVQHVEETTSPASILTLDVPVAMVDDHWASATRWALLLAERVAVAA